MFPRLLRKILKTAKLPILIFSAILKKQNHLYESMGWIWGYFCTYSYLQDVIPLHAKYDLLSQHVVCEFRYLTYVPAVFAYPINIEPIPKNYLMHSLLSPMLQLLFWHYMIFLSFHPAYMQTKLPNNSKPGLELIILDLFPFDLLLLSDIGSLLFE